MLQQTMPHVYAHNRQVWDARVRKRLAHTRTASEADFQTPLQAVDTYGWMGDSVQGKRVLCLAAGGGLQSVLFAAAGAQVTVVDLSPAMLEQDRRMASTRGLSMRLIEGSMDDLSMLGDACFDLVIQPVSTCYVADIRRVYGEVGRVTVAGGLYISQHKQPTSLQTSAVPGALGYVIDTPYDWQAPLPPLMGDHAHREAGALEFLHPWEALIGGLCRSGFVIEDLREPCYAQPLAASGSFGHRSWFVPPYVAIKARRTERPMATAAPTLVLPAT